MIKVCSVDDKKLDLTAALQSNTFSRVCKTNEDTGELIVIYII